MNARQPHEVAELDQDYAAVRDVVADLIGKIQIEGKLAHSELPAFAGAARALWTLDLSREELCELAAAALIRAAAQPPTDPPDGAR